MKSEVTKKGGKTSFENEERVFANTKQLDENQTKKKVSELVRELNSRVYVVCKGVPKEGKTYIKLDKKLHTKKTNIESFIKQGYKFEEVKE
ncbi:hypothetical protein [uncultured Mediterranean phage uvMED]|nr:hypothetical protein [uncultured Mediterranean phage uvMED]